ncbi:MAG: FKBP-type peptidyl-prolyl cis-trans isomerase [Bacteroidales bacterium]|nr:FKBP-type peptidyl-prolyl cis-trans isomerase [Bacteroidales bacterium]
MSEDFLDVENTQEENESLLNDRMEETVENAAEAVEETVEKVEEVVNEQVEETPIDPTEPDFEETAPKSKAWLFAILGVLIAALLGVGCYFLIKNTGKHKGFKKDKASGIYYKFYDEIHDDAAMPKTGDLVGILFDLRTEDSTLIPMIPNEMLMDSIGKNDIYAALRMMHVGDSATFIFNGQEFFDLMMEGQDYPFGDEPLYLDVKLYGHMPKAEFEKAKAEYEAEMNARKAAEVDSTLAYVKNNNMGAPTDEGIYIKTTKKGKGPLVQEMQQVTVDYVGKLLNGNEFDSSIGRGEPFTFTLGEHRVIPGWEIAISKMHVGDKATVLIPSSLAYGDRANAMIPAYSPLVFEIEVLKAEDKPAAPALQPIGE